MGKTDITVNENNLIESIKEIILTSRKNIVRSVNTEMLSAYWNIGRLIVEDEQKNQERAQYGEQTLKHISKRLKAELGNGFSISNLQFMRRLFIAYPNQQTLSVKLSWSHYCELLTISDCSIYENYSLFYLVWRTNMRKLFVIVAILIISIVPIFAEGQIGLSLTPEWFWITSLEGQKAPESTGMTRFMLTADGANYFGENGGFGVEYGLGMIFPVNTWAGNVTTSATDSSVGFVFRAGVGYRYAFNDLIGLAAGLGLNGFYQSEKQAYNGQTISGSEFDLCLYGRITADFTLLDFLRINAGIAIGGPIYALITLSAAGQSQSANMHMGGFFLAPFVGVSYVY